MQNRYRMKNDTLTSTNDMREQSMLNWIVVWTVVDYPFPITWQIDVVFLLQCAFHNGSFDKLPWEKFRFLLSHFSYSYRDVIFDCILNVKHRLKHSSPVSNSRAAGLLRLKRAELVLFNLLNLILNWVCNFKKIVLRNF